MSTLDPARIVGEHDDPDFELTFAYPDGDGETLFLKGYELTAGQVHELRRAYEAKRPGEKVSVTGWARRWESLFYHEWMDPEEILDITLT
jgi:hypothetical protein